MSSTIALLAAGGGKTLRFHAIDIAILVGYVVALFVIGWVVSKRASKNMDSYFLGGKTLPWWIVGTSHGASGFDVTGTMWFTTMIFIFGLKAAWVMFIWPVFDRVFRQAYLGAWIRRSNVLTGAEWMTTRFGTGRGGSLSYLSVVFYALVVTVGWLAYAFRGIGKFADGFLPWDMAFGGFTSPDVYATMILIITTAYVIFGGWYSVVLTDVFQAVLKTIAALFIGVVAMMRVSPATLAKVVPAGWFDPFPHWSSSPDWSGLVAGVNQKIGLDGYTMFGMMISLYFVRGVFVSAAGPAPGYGIQHLLSTKTPREAALENWFMSIVQLVPRYLMMTGIAVLGLVYFGPEVNRMAAGGKGVDFEQVLPLVMRDFVPAGIMGLMLAGLLAAFMGMFDSTLNSGAAYIVNDLYKRYVKKEAAPRHYVVAGYVTSLVLVVVAVVFGSRVQNIKKITDLITGLLYAGYLAPNVLKWHWWRFNGFGYFAGMVAGVGGALIVKLFAPGMNEAYAFFFLVPISIAASVAVTLMTPPEDDAVLEKFYLHVRPWGFWQPVHAKLVKKYPGVKTNQDFFIDMTNVVVSIAWQLGQILLAMSLVTKQWRVFSVSVVVVAATTVVTHFTWWRRLGKHNGYVDDLPAGLEPDPLPAPLAHL